MQELLQPERRERVLYIQIPDSDPAEVVSTARDFMENFEVSAPLPHDLRSLAVRIGELCAEGWIVALDEFQAFSRKALYPFTSELQSELDRLAATPEVRGGLIELSSLHTEMQARLEAPLHCPCLLPRLGIEGVHPLALPTHLRRRHEPIAMEGHEGVELRRGAHLAGPDHQREPEAQQAEGSQSDPPGINVPVRAEASGSAESATLWRPRNRASRAICRGFCRASSEGSTMPAAARAPQR